MSMRNYLKLNEQSKQIHLLNIRNSYLFKQKVIGSILGLLSGFFLGFIISDKTKITDQVQEVGPDEFNHQVNNPEKTYFKNNYFTKKPIFIHMYFPGNREDVNFSRELLKVAKIHKDQVKFMRINCSKFAPFCIERIEVRGRSLNADLHYILDDSIESVTFNDWEMKNGIEWYLSRMNVIPSIDD